MAGKGEIANLTNAGKGRTKGVPNKTTKALKEMILEALEGSGGVDYLIKQAEANPGPFLALVGKVLPLTVAGDKDSPFVVSVIERRIVGNTLISRNP